MYTVAIERSFSSAHNLRGYMGKCESLHGHNWKVEVVVGAEKLDHLGMVVDFTILKEVTDALLESYDHTYLNEVPPFDRINPSSENLSQVFFDALSEKINDDRLRVQAVSVWESDRSKATYRR